MLLVPYKMETTFTRIPFANAALIVVTSIIFFLPFTSIVSIDDLEPLVLRDWDLSQLLGSAFLHGGFFHLLGNMLFLWIFGNAVCGAVGNVAYPFVYCGLAIVAGATHLLMSGQPAVGASGAINGIVGMTLVFFPRNRIHVFYWFAIPFLWLIRTGKFETKVIWMILYWLAFDILGIVLGSEGIGYWAHIGGFAFGVAAGLILLQVQAADTYTVSLLDVLTGKASEPAALPAAELEMLGHTQMVPTVLDVPLLDEQEKPVPKKTPIAQPPKIPPHPEIHLLRSVDNGNTVTCYFVNKGAGMKNLQLKVPQGVTTQMNPKTELHPFESGWIRFSTVDKSTIDSIEFILAYKTALDELKKMRFRFVPSANTLTLVSAQQLN